MIHRPVIDTFLQVVYAFSISVLPTAIYKRCENIWAAVLIHAFFYFCSSAGAVLTTSENIAGAFDIISIIPIFILLIFAVCLSMFLLRTKNCRYRLKYQPVNRYRNYVSILPEIFITRFHQYGALRCGYKR